MRVAVGRRTIMFVRASEKSLASLGSRSAPLAGFCMRLAKSKKTASRPCRSCDVRKVLVSRFLESVKPSLRVTTSTLNEPVGVAGTMEGLDCIVVSDETASGGHYCNRLRASYRPLEWRRTPR